MAVGKDWDEMTRGGGGACLRGSALAQLTPRAHVPILKSRPAIQVSNAIRQPSPCSLWSARRTRSSARRRNKAAVAPDPNARIQTSGSTRWDLHAGI